MTSIFTVFLNKIARSPKAEQAALADNSRFDERAANERWSVFESLLPHDDADAMSLMGWGEADNLHMDQRAYVLSSSTPDAFLDINRPAWIGGLAENQSLVRIEALQRPLNGMWHDGTMQEKLEKLNALLEKADAGDYDAGQAVTHFFDLWNRRRDGRPSFTAFPDEIRQEADGDDWPHALRDRLGLGHYGSQSGASIPVALMRYSLQEVLDEQKARKLPTACALPTVLDGGMHQFFFPVPASHPFGATLHLDPQLAEILTGEILHCRIEYRRKHLLKLGIISRPHELEGDRLREARDLHLLSLRIETSRDDFGEELVGRI